MRDRRTLRLLLLVALTITLALAQQEQSQDTAAESAKPVVKAASKQEKKQSSPNAVNPDKSAESGKPGEPAKPDSTEATDKELHYDVSEVSPVITHHQLTINGKALNYTATTGRLPIKRDDG